MPAILQLGRTCLSAIGKCAVSQYMVTDAHVRVNVVSINITYCQNIRFGQVFVMNRITEGIFDGVDDHGATCKKGPQLSLYHSSFTSHSEAFILISS